MEARTSTTPQPAMPTLLRCRVLTGLTVLLGSLSASATVAQELYTLDTTCRNGNDNFACKVTASNVDDTTEYRHRFGARTVSYRVIDDPYVRIEGRASNSKPWTTVKNATVNFKTEELCFNNDAFCVKNPTFLADVLINSGDAMQGRTKVGMVFGSNGRVDVACFDEGCDRLKEAVKP